MEYAEKLCHYFVKKYNKIYGDNSTVVYNIHMLVHVVEDVRRLGPLDTFSAFPFESMLGEIKRKIRSTRVCRRISEGFTSHHRTNSKGQAVDKLIVNKLEVILDSKRDSCVMLNDSTCGLVKSIRADQIIIKKFCKKEPAFSYPCSSDLIDIYFVDRKVKLVSIAKEAITNKCVLLPINEKFIIIPMI